ncbi:MAG: TetR family transcriptional regulator C-terminal domain-containing protein [Clostridia bacterium]|nr:TetR family transcriptional regulator C-terminal domain-containing protein [Clostridia bacterium]
MPSHHEFIKSGISTVLRLWIENGCTETPEEVSRILFNMFPSVKKPDE